VNYPRGECKPYGANAVVLITRYEATLKQAETRIAELESAARLALTTQKEEHA